MNLYHVGFNIIEEIELNYGRKNADFGQGFYLSSNYEFSTKWAKVRKENDTIINKYFLNTDDLKILEFKSRDEKWFEYIFKNRNGYNDIYKDYDVIIGPIANDTIFDLYGIVTSGLIDNNLALKILNVGPLYFQVVIKTEKAKSNLKFIDYEILDKKIIENNKNEIKKFEEEYQNLVFSLLDDDIIDMLS